MIQRLLFDRINGKAAGAAVTGHHNLVVQILPDEAQASLAFVHLAKSGTKIALYATIVQDMPVAGFYGVFGNKFSHYASPVSAGNKVSYLISVAEHD